MRKKYLEPSFSMQEPYQARVEMILQELLRKELLSGDQKKIQEHLRRLLPKLKWKVNSSSKSSLSIFLLCHHQRQGSKFFYEMISRWLIPGKQLDISLFFFTHFSFPFLGDDLYTVSEIVLTFTKDEEIVWVKKNLPLIEKEILLGVQSFYHANRILEMKGLSIDDKTALTQERITRVIKRFPQHFDYDIFSLVQHFLVSSSDPFKLAHQVSDICRVIAILYLFGKQLERKVHENPQRRHLLLKIKKTYLHSPFGIKEVLSVFIAINLLKEHEFFEERHLVSAISHYIPDVSPIEHSFFSHQIPNANIHTFYLEVEKSSGDFFTGDEMQTLRKFLAEDIKGRIEQLVSPIFMPRNEEEVMRNILTLSHQLKYQKDIPQMMISFDEQTDRELSFTVILVRILGENTPSLNELFEKNSNSECQWSFDRVKAIGMLRKKFPKEANVLRMRLSTQKFLRDDFSVDLYRARLAVLSIVQKVIGEVRDYNGGMIAKQNENFFSFKQKLSLLSAHHQLLLQNFFHSILPVERRSTEDPEFLKILFQMFLEILEIPNEKEILIQKKHLKSRFFLIAKFQDLSWKQKLIKQIEPHFSQEKLTTIELQILDSYYFGCICFSQKSKNPLIKYLNNEILLRV